MRNSIVFFCIASLLVLSQQTAYSHIPSHVFHQLSIKDGLSEGTVRSIVEDKRGFMWFGTEDGLNKYDGYKFTVYKTDVNDTFSISSNNIKCFFNDSKGNLWIGTRHGLNLYDPVQDIFYNYNSPRYEALKTIMGDIEEITEDAHGALWIVSGTDGLIRITSLSTPADNFLFRAKGNAAIFVSIEHDGRDHFLIGTNDGLLRFNKTQHSFEDLRDTYVRGLHVRDIALDKNNNIWLATTKGLRFVDRMTGTLRSYNHKTFDANSINGDNTNRLLWLDDRLLVCIDGAGLDMFDPASERFFHYSKETGTQLSSNNITAIYKDSKGTLWVGTFLNGVNFSNITTNFFVLVKNNAASDKSLKTGVVTSFLLDSKGHFWIGTDGGGLYCKQAGSEEYKNYNAETAKPVIGSNAVLGLEEDKEGNIWAATYAGGATRLSPNGDFAIYRHDPRNVQSVAWDKLKAVKEYNNEIWTSSFGAGLSVFNKKTNTFRHYKYDPSDLKSIPSDWVYWFFEDSEGKFWIATFDGLARYYPESDDFETFKFNLTSGMDKNYVFDIYEDSRKNLWLGTNSGGLVLFDRQHKKFTSYTKDSGISDNTVKTIIEDNLGNLWLATNNGLTKFSIDSKKAVAYTIHDGLPPVSFYYNSKYKDPSGNIFFGTNEGYLIVNPTLSVEDNSFPQVVLTELRIFNVPVVPKAENTFIKTHITEAREIRLPYDQHSLSFEFAALNFSIPRQNYYAYKLEGFDGDWNYTGKNRIAKYTNLNPGTYIFKVKASNNEKIWEEEATSFRVVISPPFWQTWWFKTACLLTAALLILLFIYFRTRQVRQRNKWLQDQIRERTRELQDANIALREQTLTVLEQRKELLDKKYTLEKSNEKLAGHNEFQKKLIAIISHDIRGPLHRFSSLLNVMDEDSKEYVFEKLKENAAGLSLLSTDLLSWVTLQSSGERVESIDFRWEGVWEKALEEMQAFCAEKQVSLSVRHHAAGQCINGLPPVTLASIRNILSNAIRFSEAGGIIEIETGITKDRYSVMRITDFGPGFDASEVNRLISGEGFKGLRSASLHENAGLGMTICNDMMKRNGGWIEAVSLPASGATFYLHLPLATRETEETDAPDIPAQPAMDEDRLKLIRGKKILLADDDDELRWVLIKVLSTYMDVHEVRSAEEALTWLEHNTPDMALLDIHMSGISGIELCRKIKRSKETAHVPCMVLSGEQGESIRKDIFDAGADAFLPKPFKPDELLSQMAAYYENHERQLKRFFKEDIPVNELSQNEFNKDFLKRLIFLIESNLSTPELSVEFLARETGMSQSTLYRNLKSLTGQSANSFIKNIRMRRSLLLLKEGNLNISEIATETGFNSPSYFTTAFKKHFGFSPTEFRQEKAV